MRGSISNDGFSEAFTHKEEDRPQAGLCTAGSRGGGGWSIGVFLQLNFEEYFQG